MKIFPAVHYSMGGLYVDYDQMTNIKGLFAAGECDFSHNMVVTVWVPILYFQLFMEVQ